MDSYIKRQNIVQHCLLSVIIIGYLLPGVFLIGSVHKTKIERNKISHKNIHRSIVLSYNFICVILCQYSSFFCCFQKKNYFGVETYSTWYIYLNTRDQPKQKPSWHQTYGFKFATVRYIDRFFILATFLHSFANLKWNADFQTVDFLHLNLIVGQAFVVYFYNWYIKQVLRS